MCGPHGSGASGRGFPVNGTSAIALPPGWNRTGTDGKSSASARDRMRTSVVRCPWAPHEQPGMGKSRGCIRAHSEGRCQCCRETGPWELWTVPLNNEIVVRATKVGKSSLARSSQTLGRTPRRISLHRHLRRSRHGPRTPPIPTLVRPRRRRTGRRPMNETTPVSSILKRIAPIQLAAWRLMMEKHQDFMQAVRDRVPRPPQPHPQ